MSMNYLTVANSRPIQKSSTFDSNKGYYTPGRQTQNKTFGESNIQNSNPRLRLKDYLRLQIITKRSNSASSAKKKQSPPNTPGQKHENTLDTKQSVNILKEQLKGDITICIEKATQLLTKVDKNEFKIETEEQQYNQLVFLCQLHRTVKQSVQASLEKASQLVYQHRQQLFMKYASKNNEMTGDQMKKSTYSSYKKKRGNMLMSQRIKQGEQSKLEQSTITGLDKSNNGFGIGLDKSTTLIL